MNDEPNAALVLFSGGQDSATCLAWALKRYARVETVGFDYAQRHAAEMAARMDVRDAIAKDFPDWGARLGPDHVLDLQVLAAIGGDALTAKDAVIETRPDGLPTTFVPGRNLLFLSTAGALGVRRGVTRLVAGMCETDYSGYPDCRRETVDAMEKAMRLGMAPTITVETPLMHLSKAESWALADDLGGEALIEIILEHTHTCYRGDRSERFPWGYGCDDCPACDLRAKGWEEWREAALKSA